MKQARDNLPGDEVSIARYAMAMVASHGDKQAAAKWAAERWPSLPNPFLEIGKC